MKEGLSLYSECKLFVSHKLSYYLTMSLFTQLFSKQNKLKTNYTSIYTAFDPYPSYKGSAIHIQKVTNVLSQIYPELLLLTLPEHCKQPLAAIIHQETFEHEESNFLKRATDYSKWVENHLEKQTALRVGHFRDVWGGIPIVQQEHIFSIFEVNGIPSIELPNRYPNIAKSTLQKLYAMEQECLEKAKLILCPSETIKKHLVTRAIFPDKIHILSNGADEPTRYSKPADLPKQYVVYFGALQPWQGVDMLLKAMQYLQDKPELKLVICSSHKPKHARPYQKLADKLDLTEQVVWKHQLNKEELHTVVQHAVCSLAPLSECSRNIEQGCSPLKIFESMACKTPIVATDLPVVREILTPDKEAKFCRPDRPAELARCIRLLSDYPQLGEQLAEKAYQKFQKKYRWETIDQKLLEFYNNLEELAF